MNERHVIITADDYGLCPSVNQAIEECLEMGTLTSTNVMVNMPNYQTARNLRLRFPRAALGLHWTICQGRPVLPPERVPSLVDAHGRFLSAREIRHRWSRGQIRSAELRAELEAQHHRFLTVAGAPDYWNTHENTHLFPGLFSLFVRCGLACGIRAMRSHRRIMVPRRGSAGSYLLQHPVFLMKGLVISLYSRWAEHLQVWMPRGRIYTSGYNQHTEIAEVLANPNLPASLEPIELVVHPATQAEPDLFGSLVSSRISEYQALRNTALRNILAGAGVRLCTFGTLAATQGVPA